MRTQKWMIVLLLLNVGISSVGFTLQLPYPMSQLGCYVNLRVAAGRARGGFKTRIAEERRVKVDGKCRYRPVESGTSDSAHS